MIEPSDKPIEAGAVEGRGHLTGELARLHRALRTLSAGNRTLLHASDEQALLKEMCRVIVEEGGYCMACVGYAEHDEERTIRFMGYVGMESGHLESRRLTWADTETGRTSGAIAIRTGKPCVGRNLVTDPDYAHWREDAIRLGYASASAFPLIVEGQVLGFLGMSAAEADAFDADEVKLLSELADDLAYGIGNLRTRAKQREAEQTIHRMAYYDGLTGLPNRVMLRQSLEAAIQAARQQRRPLAVLLLEVSSFYEINDTLGYYEGDQLLLAIAQRLGQLVEAGQTLARVGEAEFALLLPNDGAEDAIRIAQQFVAAMHEPVELSSLMVTTRASIGIALFPGHGTDPDALIRRAKVAASQAKRTAPDFAVYAGSLDQESTRKLALLADLHRAIERNELLLFCQPKVHIASSQVCGAEGLLRWQHPQQGMISTGEFIKLAEYAGLITPLTHWMLDAAFRQSYAWHENGLEVPLSVNLSAHDLRDPRLLDRIKGLFATWGTRPELIQFELTESALMEDPAGALETLARLKELEVKLFIDDFGTGYSSLSYLQKLPVDSIKIDRSFVTNMVADEDSAIIVRSTIDLGHNLSLEVVAEGVESQAVWEGLADLGCDTAQGYFISQPIPVAQFGAWQSMWLSH